ncbi:MAG: phosphoglycerate dehydrogenase [Dehalococcoidia bacterium]|nr:phosphoglycerate dehydrogenase [Dehalococcoidia bacterium]
MSRILVSDPIAEDGIELLRGHGSVDVRTGLSPSELIEIIGDYDALIVRSETRVSAEVIDAGRSLKVIARAGVGVDNIDLNAATSRGVIVVNAPTGNTISAAEHTVALMLALARHIASADAVMKAGGWDRKRFVGTELRGKTLGVLGLGQVGSEVARRAAAFDMRVTGYDPFITAERAASQGIELVTLDALIEGSDFLTLHVPLTPQTKNLIGAAEMKRMRPGVRIVNASRGGIVDERALAEAIRDGVIAGAALDVFEVEPLGESELRALDGLILTPHLGASTSEAQERVAVDVAEQVAEVLAGQPARYSVNAPLIPPETMTELAPYLDVSTMLGSLATQLAEGQLHHVEILYDGDIAALDHTPLRAAVIKGLLAPISEENVTIVNAGLVAESRGLNIRETSGVANGTFSNLVTVRLSTGEGTVSVGGTYAHGGPHIVSINEFAVNVPPAEGYLIVCDNMDRPGMIGAVGNLLGEFDINISFMNVGRETKRGHAMMVLVIDEPLTPDQLTALSSIEGLYSAKQARI